MPTPLSTARIPEYVVRFKFATDPTNAAGTKLMAGAVAKRLENKEIPGRVWSTDRGAGWDIDNSEELFQFAEIMWNYAGGKYGDPEHEAMLEAWLGCVNELPALARKRAGGSYKPREHLPVRMAALQKFYLARVRPEPPLEPHFFDDIL